VPPTPIETVPDVVATAPAGVQGNVLTCLRSCPTSLPKSVSLLLPNETPAEELTTDNGRRQVQLTTGQVGYTPSLHIVDDLEPPPT
jgi:hypothetical protein